MTLTYESEINKKGKNLNPRHGPLRPLRPPPPPPSGNPTRPRCPLPARPDAGRAGPRPSAEQRPAASQVPRAHAPHHAPAPWVLFQARASPGERPRCDTREPAHNRKRLVVNRVQRGSDGSEAALRDLRERVKLPPQYRKYKQRKKRENIAGTDANALECGI